jgi:FHS family L-fucose permease-like MFS transporter
MSKKNLFSSPSGRSYLLPFMLLTSLFALWGVANDITNPMVAAFKNILLISNFESSLVQFAFYGGYCIMAIPTALYIRKFNYKRGIVTGLFLYFISCFLFFPAAKMMSFYAFLTAYFVMTCGLAFLETACNPYVLSLGPEENATQRLNLAQSFNPIGSLTGMLVAKEFILAQLSKATEAERIAFRDADPAVFSSIQQSDLHTISIPYVALGFVILAFFILFAVSKLPKIVSANAGRYTVGQTFCHLLKNKRYVFAVLTQFFYVGVQIMVWTFIIQYAELELGMAKSTAQGYNMIAMGLFVSGRFICSFLLKYYKPSWLLLTLACGSCVFTLGTISLHNIFGLYCLVAISVCMSLMYPTIYGIALRGMGEEAKLASAGLVLAIGGGAIFPPLQGGLMDVAHFGWISSVRFSFFLPLLCFIMIVAFGWWTGIHDNDKKAIGRNE